MSKHKKKPITICEKKDTLEYWMSALNEECEVCHQPMVVHSFRDKGKYRRCVFAHCENMAGADGLLGTPITETKKPCRNRLMVVAYYV